MSKEPCLTSIEIYSDLEKIDTFLIKHYDKNIETQLIIDDETFLEEIATKLNRIATANSVPFTKNGFKSFVKKLYVYDFQQFGGNDEEVIKYYKKKATPNRYDFFAIVIFVASIFVLYISFLKFNELSRNITGMNISDVSEDIKTQIKEALKKIRQIPVEQITFVQYVWSSIETFSCSIIESQSDRIRNIVTETLSNTIVDFGAIAERTCLPRTEVLMEGVYSISSSYTGDIDLGKTLNSLIQVASAVTTSSTTTACITNTALSLQRRAIEELFHQRSLILNQLSAQSSQAIYFLTYGTYMGTSACLYLVYRTKDLVGLVYAQFKIKNKGGKKTKKMRNHKKRKITNNKKHKRRHSHKKR